MEIGEGHYEMALPWRSSQPILTNDRSAVMIRLGYLQKRLNKNEDLRTKYSAVISEYIDKGYARVVTPEQAVREGSGVVEVEEQTNNPDCEIHVKGATTCYPPHHPVVHPQRPVKVRVVFDCAARHKGSSLNDYLLQGPDHTNSLLGVLLRLGSIAMVADIEAMFHQVKVKEEDWDALVACGGLVVTPARNRWIIK